MSVSVADLPDTARLWVYGADRPLIEAERDTLERELLGFVDRWTAHGADLRAAVEVVENRFAMVAVDESTAPASGCSIDKLVHTLAALGEHLGCSLLDGTRVFYRRPDGEVEGCDRATFRARFADGEIVDASTVFDPTITTLRELRAGALERPLSESWHRRLVNGVLERS